MMPASDRIRLLFDAYELANRLPPTLVYITPAVAQDLMSEYADKRLPERVHDMLEGRLAKFKLPKRVFFAPELPRNSMSKVQKNVLRERYKNVFGG